MSDADLTTIPDLPEPVRNYLSRLLLGKEVSVLDENMKVKTYHLLDSELKELEKLSKDS